MLSYKHELLIHLFRNRTDSTTDLLRDLDVPVPEHDEIQTESTTMNDLKPAEYRADLVFFLTQRSRKVFGVIVEIQLGFPRPALSIEAIGTAMFGRAAL